MGFVWWILGDIAGPGALDAAIRLAGMIRWFGGGINFSPPYDLIASTFNVCFDPAGKLDPGSRERAHYSGWVMVWIDALVTCTSELTMIA